MSRIYAVEYRYVTDQDEEMAKMRPSHRAFNGRRPPGRPPGS